MISITVEADTAEQALKALHGFFPHHDTVIIQPTLVVDAPKELKREKKSKETDAPPEAKEEKAPEQATEKAPEGAVPYSAVQEIVPKVLKVVKREVLLPMFAKFGGAKSAKDLKPEHYAEFIADAQKVIDAAPKA